MLRTDSDVLYLNDDTLWSGYPHEESPALNPKIVASARRAAFRDDYAEATRIIKEATVREKDEQIYERSERRASDIRPKTTVATA